MVPHGVSLFSFLCVTIALCTSCVSSQWSHIIHVNNENGSNVEECLTNSSVFSPCATLEYAVSGLRNSSQILLSGGTHSIEHTINISALHNISLSGTSADHAGSASGSIVHCQNGSNAGLKFVSVSGLYISKLAFMNCGSLSESTTRGENFEMISQVRIAALILNSTDIYIESTAFIDNRGIGLALFDTSGLISVLNSDFIGNAVPQEEKHTYNGGGGLYIEHTYCSPGLLDCNFQDNPFSSNSTVVISNCHFSHNLATTLPRASSTLVHQEKTISHHLGQGAAISLTLKGGSYGNNITISDCRFEDNLARYGGAVNINFQDHATKNRLLFQRCRFIDNHAEDGGGGLFVGIFFYEGDTIVGNHIQLENTDFVSNTGAYGGGAHFAISQMRDSNLVPNSISFSYCSWKYNSAKLGGALLFVPEAWNTFIDGSLPIPVFQSCSFTGNWISTSAVDSSNSSTLSTEGVIFSSTISMNFTRSVEFENNQGTALSIAGGSVNILDDTNAVFRSNSGTRGGALVLLDFASLRLFPGSKVLFKSNTATEYGGAIYASSHNDLDFYFSRSCFIRYSDVRTPTQDWDTRIRFEKNFVGQSYLTTESDCGHSCIAYNPRPVRLPHIMDSSTANQNQGSSIYAESVQPCQRAADTTGTFTPTIEHMFPSDVF